MGLEREPMNFDVFGINATSEIGEVFENSPWWWHPLWDYCLQLHEGIAGAVDYGHSSEGSGLEEDSARRLGLALIHDVMTGTAKKYEVEFRERVTQIPLRSCEYCQGTGTRRDEKGRRLAYQRLRLKEEVAIFVGRTHGWCDGCSATGQVVPWEAKFHFSEENVQRFGEFLLHSGGFIIC